MSASARNKGKGKGKGGKKKGTSDSLLVDPVKLMKQVLAEYESKCTEFASGVCPSVRLAIRESIEQEKLLSKFIVCPRDRHDYVQWADEDLVAMFGPPEAQKTPEKKPRPKSDSRSRSRSQSRKRAQKKGEPASGQALIDRFVKKDAPVEGRPLARVRPLMEAIRCKRYTNISALYVWDMCLDLMELNSISSLIAKGFYTLTKVELLDCLLQPDSLRTFGDATRACKTLTEVVLDYNEFSDNGCKELCLGLIGNKFLKALSLCYCNLTYLSGKYLGTLLCQSAVVDLLLDGNELEAEGVIYLVDELADYAEDEAKRREDEAQRKLQEAAEKALRNAAESGGSNPGSAKSSKGGKKKGGKKGGKKKGKKGKKGRRKRAPERPAIEPVLRKLHLADNGIDQVGRGANFVCLKAIIRLGNVVSCSQTLEELDLWGNDIGDVGGRLVLEFLQARKEAKLPSMRMRVGPRMNSESFANIQKLGSGLKKRKRGKRGRKKKK